MANKKFLASGLYDRVCCFLLFFVAASASFNGFYDKYHFNDGSVRSGFERMMDGTAERPFVYRQLLPAMARACDELAPERLKDRLFSLYALHPSSFEAITLKHVYFFRFLALYVFTYSFALLAVFAMYLTCEALRLPSAPAVLAPVVVILLFPYVQTGGGCFYDYSELAFFALAVWGALRFDWWWLIPLSALGAWNKESFLFFIPTLYPFLRLRHSRRNALLGVGILCLVCAAVYYPIHQRFAFNPGGTVLIRLPRQIDFFIHPLRLIYFSERTYGIITLGMSSLLPLALIAWTVWRGWGRLPRSVQRHGQIAAAINVPLFLLFCAPGELRNLSMLYIVLLLALGANLNEWIKSTMPAAGPPTAPWGNRRRTLT